MAIVLFVVTMLTFLSVVNSLPEGMMGGRGGDGASALPRGPFADLGGSDLAAVAEALLDKCYMLGSKDNITAVILVR